MLHINNEVGSKHFENILTAVIVGIGLAGFNSLFMTTSFGKKFEGYIY